MIPSRLPSGKYELTLRSKSPDGTLATSKQGVAVAVKELESAAGALQSRAEVPSKVAEITGTIRAAPSAAAVPPLPDRGPSSAVAGPRAATTTVSRGDSLWRISRVTYGDGTRYAIVYKANRDRIRDPNRIYPGQTFILPEKSR